MVTLGCDFIAQELQQNACLRVENFLSEPTNLVVYEAVYEEMYDSVERAATTATSLDVEQSYDSPLGGVNTSRSDEDKIELQRIDGGIADIDEDADITLVNKVGGRKDEMMFDVENLAGEEVVAQTEVAKDLNEDEQKNMDKGKGKMVELERPLKVKDQISFDEQEARKKHFASKRAEELRSKPLTKAQKRKTMSTYLKNMAGWKLHQLKKKSFDEIQELFDQAMIRVNAFVDMDLDVLEGTSKRAGSELEKEAKKKQKIEDDKETAKLTMLVEITLDEEEVAIDAIPLATKPLVIVDKFIRKRTPVIIRSQGLMGVSSYTRHGETRLLEGYKRVLWGDLKVMFEPHVEDVVWRELREGTVLIWKLFDSCGVHLVRFSNLQIYMLVEKKYPLTPPTLTGMLNKKLQADHLNEMCYQFPKLITRQLNNE
ncbi:hypothetical protein Tco_0680539 [Tanacetum coccineum]|uniref:Uncharacterized protein n=1 Tax=Tanacetum coccineum TaxID=301880 RepID=A0ABQ4XLV1_9ASTR